MLYHQNSLAQVKDGSRRAAASQIFSPATRRFDWRQSQTSDSSRKNQPLATQPCPLGKSPVVKVDWTAQVTAGKIVCRDRSPPARARACKFGVASPTWSAARPTTIRTTVRCMRFPLPCRDERRLAPEHGVPLPEARLVDAGALGEGLHIEVAALAEERYRVLPDDGLDVVFRDAA